MLRCADGRYSTGHTDNLAHRIGQHQAGGCCDFTERRRPVQLVWSEYFGSRLEALEAERIVGGWWRAKKQALVAGNWSMVSRYARPPKEKGFSTSFEPKGAEIRLVTAILPFVLSEGFVEPSRDIKKLSPLP